MSGSLGEIPLTGFHTWLCMCEGVGRDSKYSMRSFISCMIKKKRIIPCINCICMECECLLCTIACAFRWGVTLVGKFNYWALLTPPWENNFKY